MSKTFFVATKHEEYRQREFPAGSRILDPWRYIPDQEGVVVERIGENKPALISLLVPTRGRPNEFWRLVESAFTTATHPRRVEIVSYLDNDDITVREYPKIFRALGYTVKYVYGERVVLSEMWNECYRNAEGEILMHCGDDIVFKTDGWDVVVRDEFSAWEDRIVLVHGDDCSPNTDVLATHGFLHRRWVETVGYFVPPLFSSDWNDVWLTDVADMIGRRVKVPIVTEHMHYTFGKADRDQTHVDREERGIRDNVVDLYKDTLKQRRADAKKLRGVMT